MQSIYESFDYVIGELGLDVLETQEMIIQIGQTLKLTPRQVIRIGFFIISVLLVLILIRFADQILLFIVGVLYPAYETIKVKNSTINFERKGRIWLLYWVCYGLLSALHSLFKVILKEIPFLPLAECGVLVWLYHEKTKGVEVVNNMVFAPFFKKYGKVVEKQIDQVKETLQKKTK